MDDLTNLDTELPVPAEVRTGIKAALPHVNILKVSLKEIFMPAFSDVLKKQTILNIQVSIKRNVCLLSVWTLLEDLLSSYPLLKKFDSIYLLFNFKRLPFEWFRWEDMVYLHKWTHMGDESIEIPDYATFQQLIQQGGIKNVETGKVFKKQSRNSSVRKDR
jgi:hypothetical protein